MNDAQLFAGREERQKKSEKCRRMKREYCVICFGVRDSRLGRTERNELHDFCMKDRQFSLDWQISLS